MQITGSEKEFGKNLKWKKLDEYHNLYTQSDTFLPSDVFRKFWKNARKYMNLTLLRLEWQTSSKKIESTIGPLTGIDMLLMVKMVHMWSMLCYVIGMQKLITNTLKIMIKIRNYLIFRKGIWIICVDVKCRKSTCRRWF